jgi:AcrR family transcriptional regulator
MSADSPAQEPPRRRGPRPRHTREDVVRAAVAIADAQGGLGAVTFRAVAAHLGTGVMSLYSYVQDKQALIYDMVETASAELDLPAPTGEWRADLHVAARMQRDLIHRHPWLIEALSHLQPLGPATLAFLEWALAALEPTGLSTAAQLETISLLNGFVTNIVRGELAAKAAATSAESPQTAQFARLPELIASGNYPRFTAAIMGDGPPASLDLAEHFDRLLDRILDGLVRVPGSGIGEPRIRSG